MNEQFEGYRDFDYEGVVNVRPKKQDKKSRTFLFVLLALSLYSFVQTFFDESPLTEIVKVKKEIPKLQEVKSREIYVDDSAKESSKFAEMQARFVVSQEENSRHKQEVLVKSRKAEKKYGKILDKAQKIHGEGDRSYRNLVKAIIIAESDSNEKAVSCKGAAGAMGIMPGNFHFLGIKNPFDPNQNIIGGSKLLRSLLDKYDGNQTCALAEYNAGPGVEKRKMFPSETRNYIVRVENTLKYMNYK